ncbi:MAG: hypothetical protein H6736_21385 [Alphaproteobacteria bacterium]|nr:hypothetical protein [Alphaproteobacteria bacterium]MCB9694371.1 hypothetical protein [Alphaproteobacteria bacterium]
MGAILVLSVLAAWPMAAMFLAFVGRALGSGAEREAEVSPSRVRRNVSTLSC